MKWRNYITYPSDFKRTLLAWSTLKRAKRPFIEFVHLKPLQELQGPVSQIGKSDGEGFRLVLSSAILLSASTQHIFFEYCQTLLLTIPTYKF